jgi:serine/threonine protein kinase
VQDFRIIKLLGKGSFSSVYKAKNIQNDQTACIKEQAYFNNPDILRI